MKIPEKLRVGFKTIKIVQWNQAMGDARACYGEYVPDACETRIDTSHSHAQTVETLIHEVLHAIWDLAGVRNVKKPSEEYLVTVQASIFTQVLQDNPEFGAFIAQPFNSHRVTV